jgi:hypothetical protein
MSALVAVLIITTVASVLGMCTALCVAWDLSDEVEELKAQLKEAKARKLTFEEEALQIFGIPAWEDDS